MKGFVFSVQITSLCLMKQRIEKAIECIITQTIGKVWKNRNSENSHPVRVSGGHIEQNNV